jgi:hypothetical protein
LSGTQARLLQNVRACVLKADGIEYSRFRRLVAIIAPGGAVQAPPGNGSIA